MGEIASRATIKSESLSNISMIGRYIPFSDMWQENSVFVRARASFVKFIEARLKSKLVYENAVEMSHGIRKLLVLAKKLQSVGVIQYVQRDYSWPDEPRLFQWRAPVWDAEQVGVYTIAGGSSYTSEEHALVATLAESTERHIWRYRDDHFQAMKRITTKDMSHKREYDISMFTASLRSIKNDEAFLCTRGYSWTHKGPQYIPIQMISGRPVPYEVSLREKNTSGLATWTNRLGAVRRGLLELVERDAYMIMWLNQISLPKYTIEDVAMASSALSNLLEVCHRYRLKVHFVKLLTDAPAHVVCVVVEDETSFQPSRILGLKAHSSLAVAAEGALLEALRIRRAVRHGLHQGKEVPQNNSDLGLSNRLLYWASQEKTSILDFISAGAFTQLSADSLEESGDRTHLDQLLAWCREKKYECTSVSLTRSQVNVTPWHIEMVVVPQLQWMHLHEKNIQVNEDRRVSIPRKFGYEPRSEPFLSEPHPFA